MNDSNTGPQVAVTAPRKGQFVKGDPRINRKGRPKSFDALRALAQSLADEPATDASGQPIIIDGHVATQAEMIVRSLMKSNPERFIEVAYGKVPTPIEMSGDAATRVVIEYARSEDLASGSASEPEDNQSGA